MVSFVASQARAVISPMCTRQRIVVLDLHCLKVPSLIMLLLGPKVREYQRVSVADQISIGSRRDLSAPEVEQYRYSM